MKIAVASGKGGTGKTTLSVALALASPGRVQLLDCDVEEPNAHLFMATQPLATVPVTVPVPVVDEGRCTACSECARICRFNAIASFGSNALVFPELCHSCGGCAAVCPSGAIAEQPKAIGGTSYCSCGNLTLEQGRMDVGHAMPTPVIRAVKRHAASEELTIIDCPPGTSCPMIMAVLDADYVILVTEPTPFGLNDLRLAVQTVRELGLPFGVVVNRAGSGDDRLFSYCADEGITVLLKIPEDRAVAEAYSRGESIVTAVPGLKVSLQELLSKVEATETRGAA